MKTQTVSKNIKNEFMTNNQEAGQHKKSSSQGKIADLPNLGLDKNIVGQSEIIRAPNPKNYESDLGFKSKTLCAIFKERSKLFTNFIGKVVGETVEFKSYHNVQKELLSFLQWLVKNNFENSDETKIVFLADNCLELRMISHAINQSKMVIIPLYNALSEESIFDIIKTTKAKIIVCDNDKKMELLFSNISIIPSVELIIKVNNEESNFKGPANNSKVQIKEFSECRNHTKDFISIEEPEPNDMAYIFCTSGSTGNPKLVVHTHLSLYSTALGTFYYLKDIINSIPFSESLLNYSLLPESHILGFMSIITVIIARGSIVYPSSKDVKSVMKHDMAVCKPSIWVVVPLVLNRIEKAVSAELKKSSIKNAMFKFSYNLNNSFGSLNPLKFVFNKIKDGLGGNVKLIVCAGSLLDKTIHAFIENTTGARVVQGFGLSEGLGFLGDISNNGWHCGIPMIGMEAVLRDVPEMGYWSEKNQGEVCYRGPNVFKCYFDNEEETKKTLDQYGFLLTGDIGEIGPDGNLRIIDRKKNIFKLSQGEYICVSRIQSTYLEFVPMKDIYVHGSPLESCLVGIGFFDIDELKPWLKIHLSSKEYDNTFDDAQSNEDMSIFKKNPDIHKLIETKLNEIASEAKLKGFERVRKWKFVDFLPTIENNLLTVTFKQKRAVFEKMFCEDFKAMYNELNASN